MDEIIFNFLDEYIWLFCEIWVIDNVPRVFIIFVLIGK